MECGIEVEDRVGQRQAGILFEFEVWLRVPASNLVLINDEEANAVRRSAGPGAAMMRDMKFGVTRTNMKA
jgi:hypothetical protein